MKIGFDISQTSENKSGTGFFADQMIQAISRIDKENEYILFPCFFGYHPAKPENATSIHGGNFKTVITQNIPGDIKALDVIQSNNFKYPDFPTAKKVVTIYDVGFLDHPEYTTEANRLACFDGTLNSMLFADKIVTISEYSKERLLYFFPMISEDKISVIYLGNRDTLIKQPDNRTFLKKKRLEENGFFLSVGTIEPRKNYHTLLRAYRQYREENRQHLKLCIAGGYGWMEEEFTQKIERMGLRDDVIITGYVSDNELANLYRYCYAFVYPTWYEGFGLPALEAMNFDKPLIVSNVTSLPEVVGNAGILVSPENVDQIAGAMQELENDSALYHQLAKDGQKRAKIFSWDKAAGELLNIYKNLK